MLPWQLFLAFYKWGAHWRHLKNTTELSMCGGDAALCQITLTTCYYNHRFCFAIFHISTDEMNRLLQNSSKMIYILCKNGKF